MTLELPMNANFVLWGLKNKRDSFRFIHSGYFQALKAANIDVRWVKNSAISASAIDKNSLVFAVDIDSDQLPIVAGARYITLNIEEGTKIGDALCSADNWMKIQEYTNLATGELDSEGTIVKYNRSLRTLYMPWGTPFEVRQFLNTDVSSTTFTNEYWVGSIWNNALGQGNAPDIEKFKEILKFYGIRFKRVGGSRLKKSGLSEQENATRVRTSRLGAAVVGRWQRENQYIPCRLFKAVSFGLPPISNLDATNIFKDTLLLSDDISEMVTKSLEESLTQRWSRAKEAQQMIRGYTYSAAIQRFVRVLENNW